MPPEDGGGAEGGVDGEGQGDGEVVVSGGGALAEGGDFFAEFAAQREIRGDHQAATFEQDAQLGEEMVAGDKDCGVRGEGGALAGSDQDRLELSTGAGGAEEFEYGGAGAGVVQRQQDGEGGVGFRGGLLEEFGGPLADVEVGSAEGPVLDEADGEGAVEDGGLDGIR